MHAFLRRLSLLAIAALLSGGPACAADHAPPKYAFSVPPSAALHYSIRARQSGLMVDGNAQVTWRSDGKQYAVENQVRAMLVGKILDTKSEGSIDSFGLAPVSYTEKRFRRDMTTTTFDRAARLIRFSASDSTYPIRGGEQDRAGVIWQLTSVARAAPSRFKPGSSWIFFVAGQRDADMWTFNVTGKERLDTPMGPLNTLHVVRTPPEGSNEQQLDIWLAPQKDWYPVRIRFSEREGDYILQTLESIERSAP